MSKSHPSSAASSSGVPAEEFSFGTVVLPASNGTLQQLGHDVLALKEKALGLVLELRGNKVLVSFPEMKIQTWLPRDELQDVVRAARAGEAQYAALIPQDALGIRRVAFVWILQRLIQAMKAESLLGLEYGVLSALIPEQAAQDHGISKTELPREVWKLSLALPQWKLGQESALDDILGDRLMWVRIFPSGMHKLELVMMITG